MTTMRNGMLPLLAALAIGAATPVWAADYFPAQPYARAPVEQAVGPVTLQEALAVASQIGVVTVTKTNYDDDQWEIEGHDSQGKWIEVDVDARTGEVRNVDRSII